jgi:hypothetical protein
MTEPTKVILRNATTRPVELHLTDRVVVLAPRETFELSEPSAVCAALERRGVLTRHVVRDTASAAAPGAPTAAPSASAGPTTDRHGAAKRTRAGDSRKTTGVRQAKGDAQ